MSIMRDEFDDNIKTHKKLCPKRIRVEIYGI